MLMFRVCDHSWHGFLPQKGARVSMQLCYVDSEWYVRREYGRHGFTRLRQVGSAGAQDHRMGAALARFNNGLQTARIWAALRGQCRFPVFAGCGLARCATPPMFEAKVDATRRRLCREAPLDSEPWMRQTATILELESTPQPKGQK